MKEETKCYCGHTTYCDCGPEEPKQENDYTALLKPVGTKQETLEEAAERIVNSTRLKNPKSLFCEGAKWQQEQILDFLYSEITERRDYSASKMCEKVIEFIEQFKKK